MEPLHAGLEPWDWEKPETVEMQRDEKSGITDLASVTGQIRAQQNLHDKEQRRMEEELDAQVLAFEQKTIETVEDTYWVKQQYLPDSLTDAKFYEPTENGYEKEIKARLAYLKDGQRQ